jgi:uncharacterized protein (TIGR02646 family)
VIKVRRPRRVPPILIGPKAVKEQADAKTHYGGGAKGEFKFKVYGDRSVRDALELLFRSKCAYCETRIGAADESEIEHWRPKGAVKEDDGRRSARGYYWLASSWDNLLLACLKCNRPRKFKVLGGEEAEEIWERSGKGMLFPLATGDVRATKKGQEKSEHPLLLHPCRDDPAKYLEFVLFDDGTALKAATVRPIAQKGRKRDRADRSIDVYSLNRPPLRDRRRHELTLLQRDLAEFQMALDNGLAELMKSKIATIAERLSRDAEYRLMTKQAVADFLSKNPAVRRPLQQALTDSRAARVRPGTTRAGSSPRSP